MGLITCSKCKKIYDYDKYNGICPKCARYNKETSAAEEHQEYHDKYDGGYSHTEQDNHHTFHQTYDDNRNPHISQLKGVQETRYEVMGTEHKVILDDREKNEGKNKETADKKTKIILGVIAFFFLINFFLPFFDILFIPIIIGVVVYILRKNKK